MLVNAPIQLEETPDCWAPRIENLFPHACSPAETPKGPQPAEPGPQLRCVNVPCTADGHEHPGPVVSQLPGSPQSPPGLPNFLPFSPYAMPPQEIPLRV